MVTMPISLALAKADIRFAELPLVEMPIKASPALPCASSCRTNTCSKPRSLPTAEIIAKKLDYKRKDIVVDDRLYAVEADDLLDVIHKLGDKLKRVMLFGHNPELTELAQRRKAA